MKRKWVANFCVACITIVSVSGISGCGSGWGDSGRGQSNDPDAVQVSAVRLGYGLDWLYDVAEAFTADTGIPVNITQLVGQQGNATLQTEVKSHASDADVFIYQEGSFFQRVYEGEIRVDGKSYSNVFADLTDIYQEEYEGENGATMESKMEESMREYLNVDGHYYSVPWIDGKMGLLVNMDVWTQLGFTAEDIPLTTDEMFEVCDEIKAQEIAPFIYSLSDQYYSSVSPLWFYQYEGEENMAKFDSGLDPDGQGTEYLYTYDGQLEAMKVLERLISRSNGYQHTASESIDFTSMQSYFLAGQAVFCMNGAWIEIEMGENYGDANVEFYRVPIISSLVNKLSFKSSDAAADDDKLHELIVYVDAHPEKGDNADKPAYATDEDVERVRYARHYACVTNSPVHHMMASSYSPRLDSAKQLIKYLYSDKGMKIYYKALNGSGLPATLSSGEYDDIELSVFRQSVNKIPFDQVGLCPRKAKVYSLGGVDVRFGNGVSGGLVSAMLRGSSASEIITMNQNYISQNWSTIKARFS